MTSKSTAIPQSLLAIIETLPQGLQRHLYRTRDVALDLARRFGVDEARCELAAMGHDIYRHLPPVEMLALAQEWGLPVHPVEERAPVLLHGPLAAHRLRTACGVEDKEVLEAVHWHSTGCAGIGRVGLVVLLADKLDPLKVESLPHLKVVEDLSQVSLERAVVEYLGAEIQWLIGRGELLHPASVECRNDLLLRIAR